MKAVHKPRGNHCKHLQVLLLVAVIILLVDIRPVSGSEPLPFVVSGVISAYGEPVQDHLLVVAKINGTSYSATYTKAGRFGFDPIFKIPADNLLTEAVEGGKGGDLVELYLDGKLFHQLTFESGRVFHIVKDVTTVFNRPPTIVVDTELLGFTELSVKMDASKSSDPNGDELTYKWVHDDGSETFGAVTSHVFDTAGTHKTQLVVTDPYGGTSTEIVDIIIQPPPDPVNWIKESPKGGNEYIIIDKEVGVKLWLTPIDDLAFTIFEFDHVFVTESLPSSHETRLIQIIFDHTNVVFPIYVELNLHEAIQTDVSNYAFFSWRHGEWKPVSCSGVTDDGQTLWAYLDEDDVGDGLLLAGFSLERPRSIISDISVSPQRGGVDTVFDITVTLANSTSHILYLRVDDELVDRAWVRSGDKSVSFQVQEGVGTHEVNVNGVTDEFTVESEEKNIYMLGLTLLPVSLLSLLFFRYR